MEFDFEEMDHLMDDKPVPDNIQHEDNDNLMDDDPALDYILYENMVQENRGGKGGNGCLGVVVLLIVPLVSVFCL